jgi:DNA-binding transcriptional LysR family regulator
VRRPASSNTVWISRAAGTGYSSDVSLAQIEYFLAVAEKGHVGRAAGALRIAQPAVSRQIRKLEDELGARLFVRTSRGMTLSPEGEVFLAHARVILGGVHAARRAVAPSSTEAPLATGPTPSRSRR